MPERPSKCRTTEIACTTSELHALPPKLSRKRCKTHPVHIGDIEVLHPADRHHERVADGVQIDGVSGRRGVLAGGRSPGVHGLQMTAGRDGVTDRSPGE